MRAVSEGAWGRPRRSALKWGCGPPEPARLRDLALALQGFESTAVLHPYVYMDGAQDSWRHLTAWTFLWRLGTARGLDLYSVLLWLWFCGTAGENPSFRCTPVAFPACDCRNSLHAKSLHTVAVCLLHTQTKMQASSLVDFKKQRTTKQNLKRRASQIHPEEQLCVWSKNRKVMVEARAGMPDAVQSRKQKAWSRGLHRNRYSALLLSWDFFFLNVHTHHMSESTFILCFSF